MRIQFERCLIDTDTRQVLCDGEDAGLSPKAYQLLMLLVEARPRAVGRDALYQALWPDTFVVEANLSNLIGEIRAGLGDSAQQARVIRTLHGFGYAFSAEAEVVATEPGETAALAYLIMADGQAIPLRGPESIVGRAPDAPVRLDLPGVSRRHARITIEDGLAGIEDLESKNGTFVRGDRITAPRTLSSGDEIGFGSVRMTFHLAADDRSTETVKVSD